MNFYDKYSYDEHYDSEEENFKKNSQEENNPSFTYEDEEEGFEHLNIHTNFWLIFKKNPNHFHGHYFHKQISQLTTIMEELDKETRILDQLEDRKKAQNKQMRKKEVLLDLFLKRRLIIHL